jgi:hypothetical protein
MMEAGNRWDNFKNRLWETMGDLRKVGHDKQFEYCTFGAMLARPTSAEDKLKELKSATARSDRANAIISPSRW